MKTSIPGIDKAQATELSEKIREAWNSYFWEYSYCQKLINFGTEERTNYMGDLLNYLDDTIELLGKIPVKPNYQLALFDTVAVLQLMYIQQDLIDELRYIFKMTDSSGDDKTLIRRLRNEITGHPISRDKDGTLISSVFFTRNSCSGKIEYLRYHKDNDYRYETIGHDWSELVNTHERYLLHNLKEVIQKVKKLLSAYQKQLDSFLASFSKISFEGLVRKTGHLLNTFYSNSNLYSEENLLHFHQNQNAHKRYKYAVDKFLAELRESLEEVSLDIGHFRFGSPSFFADSKTDILSTITFVSAEDIQVEKNRSIRYEFGKLYENHPVFGLSYFLAEYKDDAEVFAELQNMSLCGDNKREYYCSYEYLRYLFECRGLL